MMLLALLVFVPRVAWVAAAAWLWTDSLGLAIPCLCAGLLGVASAPVRALTDALNPWEDA